MSVYMHVSSLKFKIFGRWLAEEKVLEIQEFEQKCSLRSFNSITSYSKTKISVKQENADRWQSVIWNRAVQTLSLLNK